MLLKDFQNVLAGDAAAVAATGSTAADAAALTARITIVSAADATKGVKLPAGDGDTPAVYLVYSSAVTSALKVYPPTGGSINAAAADVAFSATAQKPVLIVRVSSLQWLALLGA